VEKLHCQIGILHTKKIQTANTKTLSTVIGRYPILQKALSVSLHICSKGTFCRLQYDFYILYVQFFKVNHILPTSILNNKCFNILKSCYLLFHSIKINIQTIV